MSTRILQAYGRDLPLISVFPLPQALGRAPTSSDTSYPIGQLVYDDSVNPPVFYIYAGAGSWGQIAPTDASGNLEVTGNLETSNGNLVASGTGSGLLLTPTTTTAGASPRVVNGRVGVATFSGVSIAAGASQAFTITNSAVTGSST